MKIILAGIFAFILTVVLTRYVSLGSIMAGVALIICTVFFIGTLPAIVFACLTVALAIIKHSGNIKKLLNGTESKFSFKKSKDKAYLNSIADKVISLGAVGLNIYHKSCSKEVIDLFHERGLLVSIWTIKTEYDMIRALNLGADNITTRKPGTLKPIIELKTSA